MQGDPDDQKDTHHNRNARPDQSREPFVPPSSDSGRRHTANQDAKDHAGEYVSGKMRSAENA